MTGERDGRACLELTTSPSGLVRRPVAKLANFQGLAVVNAGTLITELGPEALRMIRLSDGLGWNVAQEPGRPMLDGLWVNSSYVWAYVANRLPGQPGYPVRGGAVRVERASLNGRSRFSNRRRGRFGLGTLGTQNQEVGPHRALREPVAAEDRVLR